MFTYNKKQHFQSWLDKLNKKEIIKEEENEPVSFLYFSENVMKKLTNDQYKLIYNYGTIFFANLNDTDEYPSCKELYAFISYKTIKLLGFSELIVREQEFQKYESIWKEICEKNNWKQDLEDECKYKK